MPGRLPPTNETICKCKALSCRNVANMKRKLYNQFCPLDSNAQGNYLFGLIDVLPVGRGRFKTYNEPGQSRRQAMVSYTVPNGKGGFTKICIKTFMTFGLKSSKKLEIIVKKKQADDTTFKDK
ncbi:hypothetical protein J6590_021292 [Homalodisca vitripennis]|nr:hypothetical protein J6590_021292 [Homalodisca vitripennis]